MGNVVGSVVGGFSEVLGKLLGHPLEFLSGKSCSTKCGPTWDFMCYIENFCISQLMKLAMIVLLLYFVLLLFYLSYKLGIWQCICHTMCRSAWACCAINFSVLECCCTFLCSKLDDHNRRRRRRRRARDMEALATTNSDEIVDNDDVEIEVEGSFSVPSPARHISHHKPKLQARGRGRRDYKEEHLRRALRPKSHRVHVGISERSPPSMKKYNHHHRGDPAARIRVTRTSKFAHKRGSFKNSIHHRRK